MYRQVMDMFTDLCADVDVFMDVGFDVRTELCMHIGMDGVQAPR